MRISSLFSRRVLSFLMVLAIVISAFLIPVGNAIDSRAASVNPSQYGLPGTVSATGATEDNVSVTAGRSMGTGIAGSSLDSTYQYTVGGVGPAMCIEPSLGGPQGMTGPEAQFYSTYKPFSSNAGQNSWAGALSACSISQMTVGGLRYAGNDSRRWTFVHALLSYVLGGDRSWIDTYSTTAGEAAVAGMARGLVNYINNNAIAENECFWVFHVSGRQTLVTLLRGSGGPLTGSVSIEKVDQNGDAVVGAVIEFRSLTAGADISTLRSSDVTLTSISSGVSFTTNGGMITISGLQPNSEYEFYEVSAPSDYELARPRFIRFTTDSSGNAPSVLYTMTDNRNSPVTAQISFNKIDSGDGSDLKTAHVVFSVSSINTVADAMADIEIIQDNTGTETVSSNEVGFWTSAEGIDITIGGLKPGASYVFHEDVMPDGYSGNDLIISVDANGNVFYNGQQTTSVTMYNQPTAPMMGSLGIIKIFDNTDPETDQRFWSNVHKLNFDLYFFNTSDWNTMSGIRYVGWGGSYVTSGSLVRSISGTNIAPENDFDSHWNYSIDDAPYVTDPYGVGYEDVSSVNCPASGNVWWSVPADPWGADRAINNSTYQAYGMYGGRWWSLWSQSRGEWVSQAVTDGGNGMVPVMQSLPTGYYAVVESWDEGQFLGPEGETEYINTLNSSGWHDMSSGNNGERQFVQLFFVDSVTGRTYTVDWDSGTTTGMLDQIHWTDSDGYRNEIYNYAVEVSVTNTENTGSLDVVKVDATGDVTGVSFEVWRGFRRAVGTIDSSSVQIDSDGNSVYDVRWEYTTQFNHTYNYWYRNPALGTQIINSERDQIVQQRWTDQSCVNSLNFGDYEIREIVPSGRSFRCPDGWTGPFTDNQGRTYFSRTVTVSSDNRYTPAVTTITNREYRLHIEVNKTNEETGELLTGYSGRNDVAFALYADLNSNGIIDAADQLVDTLSDSDRDGVVLFDYHLDSIFPGITNPSDYPTRYLVLETVAPDGFYVNSNPVSVIVSASSDYSGSVSVSNRPYITLSFEIDKYDAWSSLLLNSYPGDRTATFDLYIDTYQDGILDDSDVLLDTLEDTDRDGIIRASYVLDSDFITQFLNGADPFDYPTHYLVVETTAPFNYYRNDTVFSVIVDAGQYHPSATVAVEEIPYTAQLRVYKYDSDTSREISNAVFTVYNDVDGNRSYTDGVDTVAQTCVNGQLSDAQIVWNMQEGCYVSSQLRSGGYVVVETGLPEGYFYVDANGVPTLNANELYFDIAGADTSVAGFVPAQYEGTVYNSAPQIHTTLTNNITHSHIAPVGEQVELVDTVTYSNLVPDEEYILTGTLMDRNTRMAIVDEYGQQVTSQVTFTPSTSNGTVEVVFVVDTRELFELVAFEDLDLSSGIDVCEHADLDDEGQTVRIGEIHTGAVDADTGTQIASSGMATIIDYVHYEGLQPGCEYTMNGTMHLVGFGPDGERIDEGVINAVDSDEVLCPSTVFVPTEHEGFVEVVFRVNTDRFRGRTVVCFESLQQGSVEFMSHADINDEDQSVYIPSVSTNAYGADTMSDVVALGQRARITDTVSYSNLIPGLQYTVSGSLYWMYTDENGYIHSGAVASLLGDGHGLASKSFTPVSADGSIDVEFVIDTTVLADLRYDRLVVIEDLIYNGTAIARHSDLNDEGQTVHLPSMHTTATDAVTGGKVLTASTTASIVDHVVYDGLQPGKEYTIIGSVQYVCTDDNGVIASAGMLVQEGREVTSRVTFVPEQASGSVDLEFTVNCIELSGVDRLVVFEQMYSGPGVMVALHADLSDMGQTVEVCELSSSARTENGGQQIGVARNVTITDTVFYEGLDTGRQYRVETDLMNASTGQSDAHVTTVFSPESRNGSLDVDIRFNALDHSGQKFVVFECVYDDQTGMLISSHQDWNELSQTISFLDGPDIPQTGITDDPFYRNTAYAILAFCMSMMVVWGIPGKKKEE